MTILGFTGTRRGMTLDQLNSVKHVTAAFSSVHHGDCLGADAEMDVLAEQANQYRVIHPPDDPKHRAWCEGDVILPEKSYLDRDRDIVDAANYVVAAPVGMKEARAGGTWYTVRYARQRGKPVMIVWPDGTWTTWDRGEAQAPVALV